jgi:4'-phosphopantetheinyl transferase
MTRESAEPGTWVWNTPVGSFRLLPDEVHVWRAVLDREPEDLALLSAALSGDERQRADRFRFESDRRHFLAGRGLLRALLGSYLQRDPASLRFAYGPWGKPSLGDQAGPHGLCFNLAHAGGVALFAVTLQRQIGVDVERINPDLGHEDIAEHFFSPREREALRALPPGQRALAFFACWTRKEAYLKARGEGLSISLDSFDVSLAPGEPAQLLATRDDPSHSRRWTLCELDPGPGYAGALAVEGTGWRLWCGHWPDGPAC